MRVSKETAILLKDAGYDVACDFAYPVAGNNVIAVRGIDWNNPKTTNMYYSAPTIHEAADWLRSKGVHVWTEPVWDGSKGWIGVVVLLATFRRIDTEKFDTHDLAYEAGIVHGLKYIK